MMNKCWEKYPEKRPSFKLLHSNISQYIGRMADYLVMEFNPFTDGGGRKKIFTAEEKKCIPDVGAMPKVAITLIPP